VISRAARARSSASAAAPGCGPDRMMGIAAGDSLFNGTCAAISRLASDSCIGWKPVRAPGGGSDAAPAERHP
jgi:hypothetical protein